MAQIATTEVEKTADVAKNTTDNVAELSKRTADVTREAADRAEDAARRGARAEDAARRGAEIMQRAANAVAEMEREETHRSAEGTAKIGQALIELVNEQTRYNLETWMALTRTVDWDRAVKAVDWDRVLRIQSAYLRVSLDRATQLTQRSFEVTQAVMTSAPDIAKRQAKKAA